MDPEQVACWPCVEKHRKRQVKVNNPTEELSNRPAAFHLKWENPESESITARRSDTDAQKIQKQSKCFDHNHRGKMTFRVIEESIRGFPLRTHAPHMANSVWLSSNHRSRSMTEGLIDEVLRKQIVKMREAETFCSRFVVETFAWSMKFLDRRNFGSTLNMGLRKMMPSSSSCSELWLTYRNLEGLWGSCPFISPELSTPSNQDS